MEFLTSMWIATVIPNLSVATGIVNKFVGGNENPYLCNKCVGDNSNPFWELGIRTEAAFQKISSFFGVFRVAFFLPMSAYSSKFDASPFAFAFPFLPRNFPKLRGEREHVSRRGGRELRFFLFKRLP